MRRDFGDRAELAAYCAAEFPEAPAPEPSVPSFVGGRDAAERRLEQVRPADYARTRNVLDGAVTRLSPYLRHGVLGLAETARRVRERSSVPGAATKLLEELAWRDYWRRVLDEIGDGVWRDRENYKTGLSPEDYAAELPADIERGETGVDFVDDAVRELYATGYLHNQLRMKLAAYVVHWRRVRWQAGAAWMLGHLLDGDLASNNLSWQWIASTFSSKPYLFNQENLEHVSAGRWSGSDRAGRNAFSGSYEDLARRLFA
jgi:deoxyribodipyrimidine photo-lyase